MQKTNYTNLLDRDMTTVIKILYIKAKLIIKQKTNKSYWKETNSVHILMRLFRKSPFKSYEKRKQLLQI
jgi:hypothetical protein